MCGIAGMFLRHASPDGAVLKRMCDVIRHRGPDDEGFHVDGGSGIGMRRLSVIDLATGHQPLANEDNTVWIVFNGEVYNFHELRDDLTSKGHRFRTASDTEAIVHNWEQYGVEGLNRLRGMFAFCIWDSRKRQTVLVRDRFGKKPLYYSINKDGLFFGSELKCLKAAGLPMDVDQEALKLYFQWGYMPDPHTPYAGVFKLPPGGWLTYDASGQVQQGRYWRVPSTTDTPPPGLTREKAAERIRELVDESVKIRMISDVPLGAFLSGGLDSSSMVASMAMQSTEPVRTFSIGFEEADFSELPLAAMVAEKFKTEHHQIIVKPDAIALVEQLVRAFDEPFGDSSAIPTFVVSEFARRHVTVAISGDGGDEIFAGYPTHLLTEKLRKWDSVPGFVMKAASAVADALPHAAYGKNYLRQISRPTALDRYLNDLAWPYYMRKELLTPEWMLPGEASFVTSKFSDFLLPVGADVLDQAMYFEATAKLAGDMLVKVDRVSSANSLEVRCPLLDHKIAEYAATLPHSWKLDFVNGKGKMILREALGSRLPPALLTAPKKGFGVPLEYWFRNQLKAFTRDILLGKTFLERGVVSPRFMNALLEEHESGRRNHYNWIWSLLMFELWFRHRTGPDWD